MEPETVLELLEEFGRQVELQADSDTPSDPTKPWRGTAAPGAPVPVTAVMFDYTKKRIERDLPQEGRMIAYVDPTISFSELKQYDAFIDQGETWEITAFEKIQPGADILLYKLLLRR